MTEPTPTQGEPAPTTEPPTQGEPAGSSKAVLADLAAERKARQALEAQVKELQQRDPVKELLDKLGQKPEPGQDPTVALTARIEAAEKRAAEAELKALRSDVAAAKGLTPAQAKRLTGSTRDELLADADDLLASFPVAKGDGKPGTPAPDPSQGSRRGGEPAKLTVAEIRKLAAAGKHDEIEKARIEGRIDYESARHS